MFVFGVSLTIIILGILFLSIQLLKRKMKIFSVTFFLTLILTVIAPSLITTYFIVGLSCMDGCYVKKNTPKWVFTMEISNIGSLPIIEPINEAQYYFDTDLGKRWQISYESKSKLNAIQKEIETFLIDNMVKPNPQMSCYNGYWDINDETTILRYESKKSCIMIYLDKEDSFVLVRALEMN